MEDLERVRKAWETERPKYIAFGTFLKPIFESLVKDLGLDAVVDCRAKSMQSLLGKLLEHPEKTYDTVTDKLGLRIIVHFRPQVNDVIDCLDAKFNCNKIENMGTKLGEDRVGYLGMHLDLLIRGDEITREDFAGMAAEVQVRTLAQHLWADISHQISYKSPGSRGLDLARRISLTSGALELIDREFTRLNHEITTQPEFAEGVVLNALEREFFRVVAGRYNRNLSLEVIHLLLPLYEQVDDAAAHFHVWFEKNEGLIKDVYSKNVDNPASSPFLLQPEALMILDLLQNNRFKLRALWNNRFPEKELQIFAEYWGRTLD